MSNSRIIFNFINDFRFKDFAVLFRNKTRNIIVLSYSKMDDPQLPSHHIMKNYSKIDARTVSVENRKPQASHNSVIPVQQRVNPTFLSRLETRSSDLPAARVQTSAQLAKKIEFAKTLMGNRIAFRTAKLVSASPEFKKVLIDEIRAIQNDIFNIYKNPQQLDSVITKHSYELNKDRGIL